jgi:glyoxylase-like metal-dependent hydrolase (beta-lactamase superfamily II)
VQRLRLIWQPWPRRGWDAGSRKLPPTLRPIAGGVWQLDSFPAHAVNAFLVDDILFDCRTRWSAAQIARQLRGRRVSMLALTHAHPDHWGAAPALCAAMGMPIACHEADADIVTGQAMAGNGVAFRAGKMFLEGGTCAAVVRLREGDMVGDFRVVHAPGHSHGHVIYFRESDGVAVVGDLINTMDMWTRRVRVAEPPAHLSVDADENRRSVLKLVELGPSLVLPGHGPVLRDMSLLAEFAAVLSAGGIRGTAGSTTA